TAAQPPQQAPVDADAAAIAVEPAQVAQRARDVLAWGVVFVEKLRLVDAAHSLGQASAYPTRFLGQAKACPHSGLRPCALCEDRLQPVNSLKPVPTAGW